MTEVEIKILFNFQDFLYSVKRIEKTFYVLFSISNIVLISIESVIHKYRHNIRQSSNQYLFVFFH